MSETPPEGTVPVIRRPRSPLQVAASEVARLQKEKGKLVGQLEKCRDKYCDLEAKLKDCEAGLANALQALGAETRTSSNQEG